MAPDALPPGRAGRDRASRRRRRGVRLRRAVPGVVVGSTTLMATGGLIGWVAGQPGIAASAPAAGPAGAPPAARASSTAAEATIEREALASVGKALDAETGQLTQMRRELHTVEERRAAEAKAAEAAAVAASEAAGAAGSAQSTAGSGGGGVAPLAALPSVALPAMPALPAIPAVQATSGAS